VLDDPLADTVSSARELARITVNQAAAHRDARAGIGGRRLVYGAHTIGLAQASLSRVVPGLLTVLAWRACDHVAPVFEDDLLTFSTRIDGVEGGLVDATVTATAVRGDDEVEVLRWRPVLLVGKLP
jgi:acyl dehydratase